MFDHRKFIDELAGPPLAHTPLPLYPNMTERMATAFHEAGHAVASIITAPERGVEPWEAVEEVSIADGKAFCSGRGLPKRVMDAIKAGPAPCLPNGNIDAHKWLATAARTTGYDLEAWLHASATIDVAGALTEAAFARGCDFVDLWSHPSCRGDQAMLGAAIAFGRKNFDLQDVRAITIKASARWRSELLKPEVMKAVIDTANKLLSEKGVAQ